MEKVQWGEVLYSETMYPPVPVFTALGYMALVYEGAEHHTK